MSKWDYPEIPPLYPDFKSKEGNMGKGSHPDLMYADFINLKESNMTPVPENIAGDEVKPIDIAVDPNFPYGDFDDVPNCCEDCGEPICDGDSAPEDDFFTDRLLVEVRQEAIRLVGSVEQHLSDGSIRFADKIAKFILFGEVPEKPEPDTFTGQGPLS